MDRLKALKLISLTIIFLMTGCNRLVSPVTSVSTDTINPTATIVHVTPTDRPTNHSCVQTPKQISEVRISRFYWSDDGANLFFKDNDSENWYVYILSDSVIKEHVPNLSEAISPGAFGIESYIDFWVSPNKEYIIYTQSEQDKYNIYIKKISETESLLSGYIKGAVDEIDWIDHGNKLLVSINWFSPLGAPEAYVYLINIVEKKTEIIISHSAQYVDIAYLGLLPDETKIAFTSYSGKDRVLSVWDLTDKSVIDTEILPPLNFKWISNDYMIAVGYQGSLKPILFTYDISEKILHQLLPFEITSHPYIKDAVQISPNLNAIAFIDEEDQRLYLIDCINIAP